MHVKPKTLKSISRGKKKRYDELFTDDGYLNIAGLYPVQNGNYLMGSGESNDIKLPGDLPELLANIIPVSYTHLTLPTKA